MKKESERVLASNAALIARGGRRMPGGHLQPDVNAALIQLIESGYAASPVSAISRALLDAQKNIQKKHK